ncbi:hypothetical protein FHS15_003276 [Paenibacillus castaneae]|uniref:hypothetical protein n=1 Tax=Paenibacillus castaneae TaxID=474957 RepID=UPI000C9A3C37|nr:hypothetical protein [Paenibacillus castaneae]NIK78138.1 hypothetical protein [Paenibacillus castaneae]
MSAKLKMKVRSVRSSGKSSSRASVSSSSCNCRENHQSSGRRVDPAVEAMQEAGRDISDIFRQFKDERVAEQLVRAIRNRDARAVQALIDFHCRVVNFFCTHDKDCVRIFCSFGRNQDVTVTFDICVRRTNRSFGQRY